MAPKIPCDGWWHENGWGHQPMRDLRMQFEAGRISGSCHDIVGTFTVAGTLDEQGHVVKLKHYIGQHTVDYVGQYDGEGLLWGDWHIGPLKDRWMIKISKADTAGEHHAMASFTDVRDLQGEL